MVAQTGLRGIFMVLCIIAFVVFSVMSIFSAKYRPLAKRGFECVFKTLTLRPCETGLDEELKAGIVSGLLRFSPAGARVVNAHFNLLSWIFVLLTVGSLLYSALGIYNFYQYGNCDGPQATQACILNDLTGDYGRFSSPTDLVAPNTTDGISAGNSKANVTIVEFGCFSCPYTKRSETTMQELMAQYNESVHYIFKPFPLPNHPNSQNEARAVLCAQVQGKPEQLRAQVFAHQADCAVSPPADIGPLLKQLASDSGLNMTQFAQCYDQNETGKQLAAYIAEGKAAHIYATPTFFVNGKPMVGPKSLDEFKTAISEAQR